MGEPSPKPLDSIVTRVDWPTELEVAGTMRTSGPRTSSGLAAAAVNSAPVTWALDVRTLEAVTSAARIPPSIHWNAARRSTLLISSWRVRMVNVLPGGSTPSGVVPVNVQNALSNAAIPSMCVMVCVNTVVAP